MARLQGTSVVAFTDFIENLKAIAGTCFLTRSEFDNNPSKICSFSHANKQFNLNWNNFLEQAGLNIKKRVSSPPTQGRKPKDESLFKIVECLRCLSLFESTNPKINRICRKCKDLKNLEDDWNW